MIHAHTPNTNHTHRNTNIHHTMHIIQLATSNVIGVVRPCHCYRLLDETDAVIAAVPLQCAAAAASGTLPQFNVNSQPLLAGAGQLRQYHLY